MHVNKKKVEKHILCQLFCKLTQQINVFESLKKKRELWGPNLTNIIYSSLSFFYSFSLYEYYLSIFESRCSFSFLFSYFSRNSLHQIYQQFPDQNVKKIRYPFGAVIQNDKCNYV